MKKLLLVGINSVHTYNYIELINGYFDEILLITDSINPSYKGRAHVYDFSVKNSIVIFRSFSEIKKLVKEFLPSVMHIHQANTAAWCMLTALRQLKIPSIVTAWGSDILVNPQKGFFYRKMVSQILSRSDYFTADASFLAEKMKELSKKNIEVEVINFGIDPICNNLSELNNLLPQKENIIYSNRLHKKLYRIDKIILAFAFFIRSNPQQWQLVIAATGEETPNLMHVVTTLGITQNVTLTGWVNRDQNYDWYRKAKIFVSYPESDATSVSLLEAMSAGCIPVLSDLPANREWISKAHNGVITPQLCSTDFENAVELCSTNAAANNLDLVLQKASKANSRRLFLELYNRAS
ncbi:MAG: glycosyltransferase family 4 protein [Chitinophagales bacterium]